MEIEWKRGIFLLVVKWSKIGSGKRKCFGVKRMWRERMVRVRGLEVLFGEIEERLRGG